MQQHLCACIVPVVPVQRYFIDVSYLSASCYTIESLSPTMQNIPDANTQVILKKDAAFSLSNVLMQYLPVQN